MRLIVGSDRYDIHLHMQRSPLVRDLMEEVEKKSRVTMINQQLLYRGEIYWRKENRRFEIIYSRSTFASNTWQTVRKIRSVQWKSNYFGRRESLLSKKILRKLIIDIVLVVWDGRWTFPTFIKYWKGCEIDWWCSRTCLSGFWAS